MRHRTAIVLIVFCALLLAGVLTAGPLDPPAGPVVSTDTALRQTDPRIPVNSETTPGDSNAVFEIASPGSYFLTGDVVGEENKYTIEISASDVTLDLNGYAVIGVTDSFDGVRVNTVSITGVEVKNGVVRDHRLRGINFGVNSPRGCVFRDLRIHDNMSDGIIAGNNAIVERCVVYDNGSDGIMTGPGALVRDCQAFGNGRDGIDVDVDSRVMDCVVRSNTESGIYTANGTTVEGCSSHGNTDHGIYVAQGCHILANTCDGNLSAGIFVQGREARVEDNHCVNNDIGLRANSTGSFFRRNTSGDNTFNNWFIPAGNFLLVETLSAGGVILGNSGGVAPSSSDPNVNWSY